MFMFKFCQFWQCFDKTVKRVFYFVNSVCLQNGNTALSIAKRLGYISVVDTLKVVTEEVITTTTVNLGYI